MNISMFLMGLKILLDKSKATNKRIYVRYDGKIRVLLRRIFMTESRIIVKILIHIRNSLGCAITPPTFGMNICIKRRKSIDRTANK